MLLILLLLNFFFCLGVWPGWAKQQIFTFLAFSTATATATALFGPPAGSWESRAARSAFRRLCQPDHNQLQPRAKTLSWDRFHSLDAKRRGTRLNHLRLSSEYERTIRQIYLYLAERGVCGEQNMLHQISHRLMSHVTCPSVKHITPLRSVGFLRSCDDCE